MQPYLRIFLRAGIVHLSCRESEKFTIVYRWLVKVTIPQQMSKFFVPIAIGSGISPES